VAFADAVRAIDELHTNHLPARTRYRDLVRDVQAKQIAQRFRACAKRSELQRTHRASSGPSRSDVLSPLMPALRLTARYPLAAAGQWSEVRLDTDLGLLHLPFGALVAPGQY
jgi:hypothetical protein